MWKGGRDTACAPHALAPVRVDRADDLDECGTVNITSSAEKHQPSADAREERAAVVAFDAAQGSGGWQHGELHALDRDIGTISCLHTSHLRAAVLHAANESDLSTWSKGA